MRDAPDIAEVNGTRLAYIVSGKGDPVALIHGFALDMRMWDPQLAGLEDRYRVVRYDLRGFGRSAVPDGSEYVASQDLATLLDFLKIERAALVGFSFGGTVAVHFALDFPDRITSLILIDSVVGGCCLRPQGLPIRSYGCSYMTSGVHSSFGCSWTCQNLSAISSGSKYVPGLISPRIVTVETWIPSSLRSAARA